MNKKEISTEIEILMSVADAMQFQVSEQLKCIKAILDYCSELSGIKINVQE